MLQIGSINMNTSYFVLLKGRHHGKWKKTIKEQNFFMYIFVVKEFGGFQTANARSQTWYFIDR